MPRFLFIVFTAFSWWVVLYLPNINGWRCLLFFLPARSQKNRLLFLAKIFHWEQSGGRYLIFTGVPLAFSIIFFAMPGFILFSALLALAPFYLRKPKIKESLIMLGIFITSVILLNFVNQEANKTNLVAWESVRLNTPAEPLLSLTYRFFLPLGILPLFFIPALFYIRKKAKIEYLLPVLVVGVSFILFVF